MHTYTPAREVMKYNQWHEKKLSNALRKKRFNTVHWLLWVNNFFLLLGVNVQIPRIFTVALQNLTNLLTSFSFRQLLHPMCWKFPDFQHLRQQGETFDYRSLKRTASAKPQKQSCRRSIPIQHFLATFFCHSWSKVEEQFQSIWSSKPLLTPPCSLICFLILLGSVLTTQGLTEMDLTEFFCLMTVNTLMCFSINKT